MSKAKLQPRRVLTEKEPRTSVRAVVPCVVLAICLLHTPAAGVEPALPTFKDVTTEAGIHFKHSYGDHNLSNIVEGTGPGCAFFDFDGDGFQDVYLLNGCWLREVNDNLGRDLRGKLTNTLYRNNGDGTFTDVTASAGVGHDGYGMGASAADYDNDGDVDLYVLNYGPNVLYRNNGEGTFTDVTARSGLADPSWSVSAPWLDYDADGDLDVYVANYLAYDAGKFRDFYPAAGYPGPLSYRAQPDRLYRNNGDGTFTDVTKPSGLHYPDGRAMSAIAADLSGDGHVDLYVANDATPNGYFLNSGAGTFADQALLFGVAFGEGGQGASSMGPVIGDVNRNGHLDVYIPDMGYGCLLINEGDLFTDVTGPSGLAVTCGQYTGWGGGLIDFDNDGHLDIFVANGNAHHEYSEEDVLLRNNGAGRFLDVAVQSGAYFHEKHVGRGAGFADYDNDGDVDILVMNLNGPAKLLRNDGGNRKPWLKIVPRLARSGRVALGARITVTVGALRMVHEVTGVTGYLSQSDSRAHFGLGQAKRADRVEIRWPDGETSKLVNVKANQILEVVQPTRRDAPTHQQRDRQGAGGGSNAKRENPKSKPAAPGM
ncbi:MAG: CRTAC1 family protein [bacterium]|nr:CRTAC1 family protein [bacterium]